jgi:hypothetical protein
MNAVTPVARSATAGLLVMAMIYTIGETPGAHMNTAATFAFALRGISRGDESPSTGLLATPTCLDLSGRTAGRGGGRGRYRLSPARWNEHRRAQGRNG